MTEIMIACAVVMAGFLIAILFMTIFTVDEQTVAVVQRFGRFLKTCEPGLNFKVPFFDSVAGIVSLRVQQLDVKIETKTKDNVFVNVVVSVQYEVLKDSVRQSFYKLDNAHKQIQSYVFDSVRACVPKITLDDVFEKKDEIANAVKTELSETMDDFGYLIVKALITDIDPDEKVKRAMNEINAAQRERVAASEKGEAEKILKVKQAEAEAESKALQGKGIANQRKAIVDGLKTSVTDFSEAIPDINPQDVMNLVMLTQYFDTLKEIGGNGKVIFVPHSPGGMGALTNEIRSAIMSANESKT
jgi:regulator of protease activity HflC (stomatin/prohibitin superfamily)